MMDLKYYRTVLDGQVKIFPLERNKDARGQLMECFRADHYAVKDHQPAMCYVSVTHPGVVRGPHEHRHQTDLFIFPGPGVFRVHLWSWALQFRYTENKSSVKITGHEAITAGETNRLAILIPPGIVHGYQNISQVDALMLNMPDKLWRGRHYTEDVDEIRHELENDSLFRIE